MVKSIQIFLAIVIHYENEFWQMDVKAAFLNGNLTEEVYMTQPEGFTSTDSSKVCKALEIHLWIKVSIKELEHPF